MEKTGNIYVIEAEDNFKRVHKSIIESENIDCETLGIYTRIIVLGAKWNLNIKGLSTHLKLSDNKIRKAISSLEREGYIVRTAVKMEDGKFAGWNYKVFPYPTSEKERSSAGKRTLQKTDTPQNGQHQERTTPRTDNTENGEDIIDKLKEDINLNKEGTKTYNKAKSEWRADFDVYRAECKKAMDILADDKECEADLIKLYPNIDYYRTIKKSLIFWESEKGWEYKKKSRSVGINMVATLKKNLDKSIVYKNAQDKPVQNERLLKLRVIDANGTLEDGTIFKNGYRYCKSIDGREYSIPVDEVARPDERWEYDFKKGWYLPEQKETLDDLLW